MTARVEDARFAHLLPRVQRTSRDYDRRQWRAGELSESRTRRLRTTLIQAVSKVPWYRQTGVTIAEIESDPWAALGRFPLLEKDSVRTNFEDFVADDFDPGIAFRVMTSGSTGVPLTLMHDEDSLVEEAASFVRPFRLAGLEAGDRICRINSDATRPAFAATVQLLPMPMELGVFNVGPGDGRSSAAFAQQFAAWSPRAVFGNPSDIAAAAEMLREEGWHGEVHAVLTAGEELTPRDRAFIESVLESSVLDIYSMQELRGVAWRCDEGTLHVNDERVVIESVRTVPEAAEELVITTLSNRTMPLIRYRTADLGSYRGSPGAPCPCGRVLGRITGFQGRDRGFVVLPDGRLVGPKPIKEFLTGLPGVQAWQLVQSEPESITVHLVGSAGGGDDDVTASVERVVRDLTCGVIDVRVGWVGRGQLVAGEGKFQMMRLTAPRAARQGRERER